MRHGISRIEYQTYSRKGCAQSRARNFEAGNGRVESNMLVKNRMEQRGVHKGQGECWQWQANGQCSNGDKCSLRPDENKRAKATTQPALSPEPSTQQDGENSAKVESWRPKSIWESLVCRTRHIFEKVLVQIHLVKNGIPGQVRLCTPPS